MCVRFGQRVSVCVKMQEGGVSAVNKRLLGGGFGAKSWLGILINHRPSGWILTSRYSFICCRCSPPCPPALLASRLCISSGYPTSPLPSSLWMALLPLPRPSLSIFPPLRSFPPSLLLSSSLPAISLPPVGPRSSQGLAKASGLPKTLFSSSARLIDSAGAKKKKKKERYIPHNLFMPPFDMCDI